MMLVLFDTDVGAVVRRATFSVALIDERGRRAEGADIEMVIDARYRRKRKR